jgi:phage tail sheath protein FI
MGRYSFPDVYGTEVSSQDGPVKAASLGYGCLIGITEKGPVGIPTRARSFDAWKKIFGNFETRSDMAYEAKAFFDEGGFELITIRQAHYTNLDVKTSFAGGIASKTFLTEGVAATSASHVTYVGPFNLETSGKTIVLDVDNAGDATVTFTATTTDRRGTGATYTLMNTKYLDVAIDGGAIQRITFTAGATTAATTAAEINAVLYGGHAELVDSDEVAVYTDTRGSSGSVKFESSSNCLTELGMTSGTTVNTGSNVGNIRAVTNAELRTRVQASTTALVTLNDDGSATIYSPTTGVSSELDFDVTSTGLTPFGFQVEVITGTAAGATFNALKLESGYRGTKNPGVYGNRLTASITQTPFHPSVGANLDLFSAITASDNHFHIVSPRGINPGSVLKITDGTNTEYVVVEKVTTSVSGSTVSFVVDITSTFVHPYVAAVTTIESCEFSLEVFLDGVSVEVHSGLSMNETAANYVETVLNDEILGSAYVYATNLQAGCGLGADLPDIATLIAFTGGTDETAAIATADWVGTSTGKTGIYAMDTENELLPFATVGTQISDLPAVTHASALYAKNRLWFKYYGYVPTGYTAAQAVAFRESTLGVNSSYADLYAGGIKVFDPIGVGSSPKRSLRGMGALMGLRSRVDNMPAPNGGPWQAAAGEGDYGTLVSALDVVDVYTNTEHGLMNDAHINVIRKFTKTSPVTVWGARTLDASASQNFRYTNTRGQFQFFQKSIVDGTRWAVFRNNDHKTWKSLKSRITAFLKTYLKAGAFPSAIEEEAFYVLVGVTDGVMDQADINNGYIIGKVGIAPQKPGEFIEFQFAQYTAGADVTE